MTKKRVLITGASGFVGFNLALRLHREGYRVHCLLRPSFTPWRFDSTKRFAHMHQVSLFDQKKLTRTIASIKPHWIFHLAAYGAYSWQNDFKRICHTNIIGTFNLLRASLDVGFEAFVNTGSSSEYGFKDHPAVETDELMPNSAYAVTKASSTLLCRFFAQKHAAYIPTVRLYSVYGPYEEPGRLIPALVVYGLEGKFPALVHPGIARDFIYIEDVEDAFIAVASRTNRNEYGPVYNIGSGLQISMAGVVKTVSKILPIHDRPLFGSMPRRSWDTKVWIANAGKAKIELGWRCRNSFKEGFAKTVAWFTSNKRVLEWYRKKIL